MSKPDAINSTSAVETPQIDLAKIDAPSLPIHDARALTQGGVLAQIALDGQIYTLRITRAGKLILTK